MHKALLGVPRDTSLVSELRCGMEASELPEQSACLDTQAASPEPCTTGECR